MIYNVYTVYTFKFRPWHHELSQVFSMVDEDSTGEIESVVTASEGTQLDGNHGIWMEYGWNTDLIWMEKDRLKKLKVDAGSF